ncbi:MAG: hypothetical protein II498_04175 [Ruminococcus sp.]|nr:hypothetical protein [Ruminococcus sp.]
MRGTLQYLSADFRDGQITVAGKKYPAGTFCVHLLNRFYAHDTAARIAVFKTNILQAQRTLERGYLIDTDFIKAGTDILQILQTLPKLKPFDRLDTEAEKRRITALFQKETADRLSDFLRQKEMGSNRDDAALYLNGSEPDDFHEMMTLLRNVNDTLRFYESISDDICEAFEALCAFVDQIDTCERFDEAHLLPLAVQCFAKRRAVFETEYVPLQKTRKSKAPVTVRRLYFSDFYSFIVTDFFEGLHYGHYPRRCAACENCFLMQSARRQKYCTTRKALMTVNGKAMICRKYGVYVKKKEQAKDHPVIDRYTKRCACIRVDYARGNIDEAFATAAKALAKERRFRAIHDPEYEASGYAADMTRDKLYRDTEKRMKKEW